MMTQGEVLRAVVDRVVPFGVFLASPRGKKLVLAVDAAAGGARVEDMFRPGSTIDVENILYDASDDIYRARVVP